MQKGFINLPILEISDMSEKFQSNWEPWNEYLKKNSYFIRRADQLIQEDKDDVIPYCIAIGDVKKLVNFFMSRGQLKEALLIAQVHAHNYTGCICWWVDVEGRKFGWLTRFHMNDKVIDGSAYAHLPAFYLNISVALSLLWSLNLF